MAIIDQNDAIQNITGNDIGYALSGHNNDMVNRNDDPGDQIQQEIDKLPGDTISERLQKAWISTKHNYNVAAAAFENNNIIGSLLTYGPGFNYKASNYNGPAAVKGTEFEPFAQDFLNANSDADTAQIKENIQKQQNNQNLLANSGSTAGLANIAAGIINPINAIPFLGEFKGLGLLAGTLKGIATGAVYGATLGGLNEVGIKASGQPETQDLNVASNMVASAMFGGILGGAVGLASRGVAPTATNYISTVLKTGEVPKVEVPKPGHGLSVGAALADTSDSGLAHLGGNTSQRILGNILSPNIGGIFDKYGEMLQQPVLKGLTDKSPFVRGLTQRLFSTSQYLIKNTEEGGGLKTDLSVEEMHLQDHQDALNTVDKIDQQYTKYLENAKEQKNSTPLSKSEFNSEVFRAQAEGQHTIPEVKTAADHLEAGYSKIRDQLNEINELPADLTIPEANYQRTVYDTNKIIDNRKAFIDDQASWLQSKGHDSQTAQEKASDFADKIIGRGDVRVQLQDMAYANLYKGTPWLEDRTWLRPQNEQMQWLKTDASANYLQYAVQASRLYRTKLMMKQYGVDNINDLIKLIDDDIPNSEGKFTDKDAAISKQLAKDMLDINTGNYLQRTKFDTAIGHLKFWNYISMMGSVPVTAITHLGVPLLRYHLGDIMQGYSKYATDAVSGLKGAHLEDLRQAGYALDRTMNSMLRDIIDPTFTDGFQTKSQHIETNIMDKFGKITGMSHLVNYSKELDTYLAEGRLLKNINNWKNLSKSEKEWMAINHIDDSNVRGIQQQLEKWGDKDTGLSNYRLWNNKSAKETIIAALNKEIGNLVPRPGKGNMLFGVQKYKAGSAVMQFTNFFNALTSNVLIPAMQARQARSLLGIMGLTALGSLSYILKEKIAGREPDLSPDRLLTEGMSRSALLGLFTSKIFGSIIGANYPDSIQAKQQFYKDALPNQLLGPSASTISEMSKLMGDIGNKQNWQDGSLKGKLWKTGVHLLPGNNIWYLKGALNAMSNKD